MRAAEHGAEVDAQVAALALEAAQEAAAAKRAQALEVKKAAAAAATAAAQAEFAAKVWAGASRMQNEVRVDEFHRAVPHICRRDFRRAKHFAICIKLLTRHCF